jgi:hypothetical protein
MQKKQRGLWDAPEQAETPKIIVGGDSINVHKTTDQPGEVAKHSAGYNDPMCQPDPTPPKKPSTRTSLPPASWKLGQHTMLVGAPGNGGKSTLNQKVIPVDEYREMVNKPKAQRKPKEKISDYDKWKTLPMVTEWRGDMCVIYGHIPSKSNSYKIITIPGKKQDCPDCTGVAMVDLKCPLCGGSGKIPGHPHSSLGKTQVLRDYEKQFFIQCGYRDKYIDGHFELSANIYFPTMRSDLDGCLKILLDGLQTCRAIRNDNRLMKIKDLEKFIDKENPRIEFKIMPRI